MAKVLVNSSGKVLLRDGKVATSDSTSCCCTTTGTGACCVGEDCSILSEADCTTAGGTYHGDDTVCDPNPCLPACCTIQSIRLQGSIVGSVDCSPCDSLSFNCPFDHTWTAPDDFDGISCNVSVSENDIDASGFITCPGDETETCGFNLSTAWGDFNIAVLIYSGFVHAEIGGLILACGASIGDNVCSTTQGTGFFDDPAWIESGSPNGVYELSDTNDPNITYSATLTIAASSTSQNLNTFNTIVITLAISYSSTQGGPPCTTGSGSATLNATFNRVDRDFDSPIEPGDNEFQLFTDSNNACAVTLYGPHAPVASNFPIFPTDIDDQLFCTVGSPSAQMGVSALLANIDSSISVGSMFRGIGNISVSSCVAGECGFDPGDIIFPSVEWDGLPGTYVSNKSDSTADWSYTASLTAVVS